MNGWSGSMIPVMSWALCRATLLRIGGSGVERKYCAPRGGNRRRIRVYSA
jgi:hypothetical protein